MGRFKVRGGGHKTIFALNEEILTCNKCGACREVCPVFAQVGREPSVARGKMALLESLLRQEIEVSEETALPFSQCLLCMACTQVCANQIPILKLIPAARSYFKEKLGRSRLEKVFFGHVLQSKTLLNGVLKGGSVLKSLLTRPIPEDSGLKLRFPLYMDAQRRLPDLPDTWLSHELSAVSQAAREKGRVAFFSGCMINYVYPEVGFNLVHTLNRAGITVLFPKDQKCCGTPVYVNGDFENAYRLARDWVMTFSKLKNVDAILTACASCGAALKESFSHLLKPESWTDKNPKERVLMKETWDLYISLQPKLMDVSEYLIGHLFNEVIFPRIGDYSRVAYHDPCHLRRGLGIYQEPRQILGKIFGQSLVELPTTGSCCGGGGTFSLYHYQLSRQINRKRIEQVESSRAELLVTTCPLCKAHLLDGCYQDGLKIQVVHLLDLFSSYYAKIAT